MPLRLYRWAPPRSVLLTSVSLGCQSQSAGRSRIRSYTPRGRGYALAATPLRLSSVPGGRPVHLVNVRSSKTISIRLRCWNPSPNFRRFWNTAQRGKDIHKRCTCESRRRLLPRY